MIRVARDDELDRLGEDELTDGLRKIRAAEAAHGLDRWPRVAMRRESLV